MCVCVYMCNRVYTMFCIIDVLAVLEADALKETKALAASGKRRTSAQMPVSVAEHFGISFYSGFRQSGRAAADVEIDVESADYVFAVLFFKYLFTTN